MNNVKITVFTPTFNRAYILHKLYDSLKKQTFTDFEWLIVDDGSTDNTEDIVSAWQGKTNFFKINYFKKINGGKCSAINYGLEKASGDYSENTADGRKSVFNYFLNL